MKKKIKDEFARDKIGGEYEKPGPKIDQDAAGIAEGLSRIFKREKTGFVLNWLPVWAKRAQVPSFSFFFFEDKLAVDSFGRDVEEMDARDDDFTKAQLEEIAKKTFLCRDNEIKYIALGPDDELDITQLAARMGRTTFKRGSKQVAVGAAAGAGAAGDGIEEEDLQ